MTKEDREYFDKQFSHLHKQRTQEFDLLWERIELEHEHFIKILENNTKKLFEALKIIAEAII